MSPTLRAVLCAILVLCAGPAAPGQDASFVSSDYVSRTAFHRLRLPAGDPLWNRLEQDGAILRKEDYGSFAMAIIDERALGGRAGLDRLRPALCDYESVIAFDGLPIDTATPESAAEAVSRLPASLVMEIDLAASGDRLFIVQFAGPIKDEWLERLDARGARRISYIAHNAYIVRSSPSAAGALRADPAVHWVAPFHPALRLDPAFRGRRFARGETVDVLVQFAEGEPVIDYREALLSAGFEELRPAVRILGYLNLRFRVPATLIPSLAAHPDVLCIEPLFEERLLDEVQNQVLAGNLNSAGSSASGPGYLNWLATKGFPSNSVFGFAVDVTDDGVDRGSTTDVNDEFREQGLAAGSSRIAWARNHTGDPSADGGGGHGNLQASIIGGFNSATGSAVEDAAGHNYGLGVCPFVRIGNTKVFRNDGRPQFLVGTPTRLRNAWQGGGRISNNSWGSSGDNSYSGSAQEHDAVVRDADTTAAGNQEMTIVFAAGNDGQNGAGSITAPATAKNVIAVGASENPRMDAIDGCGVATNGADDARDIAFFSSLGPTADGRRKPDLVAPGTHVQGAKSRSLNYPSMRVNGQTGSVCDTSWPAMTNYCRSSGTSHAAPAVAGAAALIRQHFANQGLPVPSPALTKAWLMSSARYLTGSGANDDLWSNSQGMGRVDLGRAFDSMPRLTVDQTHVFGATGETYITHGWIHSSCTPLRIGLAWTDKPGPLFGAAAVNDLDLELQIGGNTYRGNVFQGAVSVTGGVADAANNAEFIVLPAGISGPFVLTVRAANIVDNGVPGNADSTDQDFALVAWNAFAPSGIQLRGAPEAISVSRGGSGSLEVTSPWLAGFGSSATLALSASSTAAGLSFGFSQGTITGGAHSVLTVSASATAALGTHTVTITGTGAGLTMTTTVSVAVSNPTPPWMTPQNFGLWSRQGWAIVQRNQSTQVTVRKWFTGLWLTTSRISLSASPPITGLTCSFNPQSAPLGTDSILTITAAANAPLGTTVITITGTSGSTTRTATFLLTIEPPPAPDFSLCPAPQVLSIVRGGSGFSSVGNLYTGLNGTSFIMSAVHAIPGVSTQFWPLMTLTNGSSGLNIGTSSTTPLGTHPITILATVNGTPATRTILINVTP